MFGYLDCMTHALYPLNSVPPDFIFSHSYLAATQRWRSPHVLVALSIFTYLQTYDGASFPWE